MLIHQNRRRLTTTECLAFVVILVNLLSDSALADPVYRCGEAYSNSSHCAAGTATAIHLSTVRQTQETNHANAATRDLRDAQALEKQRRQVERQATQAASIQLITPSTQSLPSHSDSVHLTESNTKKAHHNSGHGHTPNGPYFTAVDPTAVAKKKSSSKTAATKAASGP